MLVEKVIQAVGTNFKESKASERLAEGHVVAIGPRREHGSRYGCRACDDDVIFKREKVRQARGAFPLDLVVTFWFYGLYERLGK